ncbi:hypothetical protein [Pleomorphomonas oryzae]|uniref:hypothetical protein n=1 Tax=Pleomorphomonas oryzae TaxID=261934 RepID=UPI00047C2D3C|nr:hypothetical protein [Pleomorphomonas oryzae]
MQISLARTVGLISILVILAGWTPIESAPATEEERLASLIAVGLCVKNDVKEKYDKEIAEIETRDSIRDGNCNRDYQKLIAIYTLGLTEEDRIEFLSSGDFMKQIDRDLDLLRKRNR